MYGENYILGKINEPGVQLSGPGLASYGVSPGWPVASIVKQHAEAVYSIASMQYDYFSCLPNASGLEASPCVTTRSLIYATNFHNEPFSHDHFGFHKVNPWAK